MASLMLVGLVIVYLYFLLRIKEVICQDCGFIENLRKHAGGNLLIEIILWCCFIIPGLIYSIWSTSSRRYTCPSCSGHNLIPTNSPAGKMLVNKFTPQAAGQPTYEDANKKNKILKIIGIALFIIFGFWNFTNKRIEKRDIANSETKETEESEEKISSTKKSKSQKVAVIKKTNKTNRKNDLNSILALSKERYLELCSSLSSADCYSVAKAATSEDDKGKLALQLCLNGEMEKHNPCAWMFFFYDRIILDAVIKTACEERKNRQACVEHANTLAFSTTRKIENRKKGIEILTNLCSEGMKEACKSLAILKAVK